MISRLPSGSSVHASATDGWISVVLNVPQVEGRSFAAFCYWEFPHCYWENGFPRFYFGESRLAEFVDTWQVFNGQWPMRDLVIAAASEALGVQA